LQSLELNGSGITDEGLQYLVGFEHLESLSLSSVEISDGGLLNFRSLTNLHVLTLRETKVTDRGLDALKGLRLTSLDVRRSAVTPDGVARFRGGDTELVVLGPK
jgi:hypothetical protein